MLYFSCCNEQKYVPKAKPVEETPAALASTSTNTSITSDASSDVNLDDKRKRAKKEYVQQEGIFSSGIGVDKSMCKSKKLLERKKKERERRKEEKKKSRVLICSHICHLANLFNLIINFFSN